MGATVEKISPNELGISYRGGETLASESEACVLCGAAASGWLSVPAVKTADPLVYLKCGSCGTVFLPKDARHANFYYQIDDPSEDAVAPVFLKHYLEIGAGPDFMAKVLCPELTEDVKSFCSVGCGSGLDLDIVARLSQGKVAAIGFEPNPYGRVDDLNVEIESTILDDGWLDRTGRRFDLVFASEVIEHVPDPLSFAITMRKAMSQGIGRFVLTTPNANLIAPENRQGDVYAALFPGEHKIIFTADSLREVLRKAGFSEVAVYESPHRLTAVGSDGPIRRGAEAADDPFMRYLESFVSSTPAESRSALMAGNSYRYFAELVNKDRIPEALSLVQRTAALSDLCDDVDGIPVIKKSVAEILLSVSSFEEHVQRNRAFLGPFAFYLAMLALRLNKPSVAADGFMMAHRLLRTDERVAPFYFQVSCALIDPCGRELCQALMSANRVGELLDLIADGSLQLIPEGVLGQSVLRAFVDVANRGQEKEAQSLLSLIEAQGIRPVDVSVRKLWFSGRRNRRASKEAAILKFDYSVTRAHHEINVKRAKKPAVDFFAQASCVSLLIPSFDRLRTLRKLASSVLR